MPVTRTFIAALIAALAAAPALGQPVTQGGQVTPNHPTMWTTNGIIGDAGTSDAGGLTTLGITSPGTTPFCINNGSVLAGPYSALCLGINPTSGATLTVQAFGGATPLGLNFVMNGTLSSFSIGANGVPSFSGPTSSSQLILGTTPNNILTLTPGATSSNPVTFVQSGTGGYTFDQNVTVPTLSVAGAASFGSINGTPIGNITPSTGAFTTLGATGAVSLTGSGTALAVTNNATFGSINSSPIGATTPGTGAFTTLAANGASSFAAPATITDSTGHNGAVAMTFPTRAALLAFQPTNVGTSMVTATVAGRFAPGDGGAATYSWVAASTATVLDPFVYEPNSPWSGAGRWVLNLPAAGLSVLVGFAKCDGSNDDSLAVSTLFSNANTQYTRFTGIIPTGVTCIFGPSNTVTIARRQELRGVGSQTDTSNGSNTISQIGSVQLAPSETIMLGGTMRNLQILVQGLDAFPANMEEVLAAYATWTASGSVAITAQNDYATVEDVHVIGFNTAFLAANHSDIRIRNFSFDAINGIDLSHVGDTATIDTVDGFVLWSQRLGNVQGIGSASCSGCATTVQAGGTGYTTGDVLTMGVSGTTSCVTLPQIKVVASGGVITGLDPTTPVIDTGQCADINGPNPVAFTGGTGTGATFNVFAPSNAWHSGICVNIHDAASFTLASGISCESYHIGLQLNNVGQVKVSNAVLAAGFANNAGNAGDTSAVALNLIGGLPGDGLTNIHTSANTGTSINFGFSGSYLGAASNVTISDIDMTTAGSATPAGTMVFGSGSTGTISNLYYGANGTASFTTTGAWNISNVNTTSPAPTPWYTIDAASAPLVSLRTSPRIVALNSGAALTALCNDTIYVNDTTAPTITMPAVCPLNAGVLVKDAGAQAGTHNITLSMPGGSTIENALSSTAITTNLGRANVGYNGVAAYLQ